MVALASGEETTKKILEFQVGIEPTTSVTLVECTNHGATGTPGELGLLTGFFFTQSVPPALRHERVIFLQ